MTQNVQGKYLNGCPTMYDSQTGERMFVGSPIFYQEDFLGAGKVAVPAAGSAENGVDWTKKIVGTGPPVVAGVANAAAGIMQCALTATSEKQDADIYHGDQLNFDVTKALNIEFRAKLSVLPSAAGVQFVGGLASAWADGPDNQSIYLEFAATANGLILLRSKDGVNTTSISSGVTVLATDWHRYHIDAADPTNIKFAIDGVKVSVDSATAFAATGSSAILQPYFSMYKPSGTGVGTLQLDYVRAWANRQ